MKFGFIGAGKVGCSLGKYLSEQGITVTGYFSRTMESARWAADFTQSQCFFTLSELTEASDVVCITVPDGEIPSVFENVQSVCTKPKCFIHCSGLLSSEVFHSSSGCTSYGYSIHPLLAVSSKENSWKDFSNAIVTIEGHPRYREELSELFRSFGNEVIFIRPEEKVRYHAAAAMASNLVTGVLSQSMQLLVQCGFTPEQGLKALGPLVRGNVEHVLREGCVKALTGPVERGDISTVKAHLDILPDSYRETYRNISLELVRLAEQKHPEREYEQIERLLAKGEEG